MWPSKFAFRISVRTAECQGPQSCLPERIGTSFVEGNKEIREVRELELLLKNGIRGGGPGKGCGGKGGKGRERKGGGCTGTG